MECLSTADMFGAMLLVFGTFVTFFSLTFFVSRPKIGTSEFLLVSLNSLNVVISLYLVRSIPAIRDTHVYHTAHQFYDLILYLSLFIACLMSVTRMVQIVYPSAQPLLKIKYLLSSILLFTIVLTLPFMIEFGYFPSARPWWFTFRSTAALVVVMVSLVCGARTVFALLHGVAHEITSEERRDTVTSLALVFTRALFVAPHCLLYFIFSLLNNYRDDVEVEGLSDYSVLTGDSASRRFLEVWSNYAMPINSVIDVVVFFVRIGELRTYSVGVVKALYKLTHCDCEMQKTDAGNGERALGTPPPSPSAPQARIDEFTPI